MPRDERVLVVMVASPSDLEAERARLEDVVRELNLTWSRTFGLRLELVRWETHGYPGVGQDPQGVLNRELTDEPDIFIGMMWGRYGTPTGRAGSGTEEEFSRALARHTEAPQAVRIMFYFKDAPIAPSAIDSDQIGRVQRFQSSLGAEGALYWKFTTLEEFERLLRLHLARQIQEFVVNGSGTDDAPQTIAVPAASTSTTNLEEFGLLDYLDQVDDYFGSLVEIAARIAGETSALTERMEERTREMNEASASASGKLGRREARVLIERAASDLEHFTARMQAETPLFRESLRKGADAAARAALIGAEMAAEDREQVRETRRSLMGLRDALGGAHGSTDSFKASVRDLPRMTSALNKAKREAASVLQEVVDSLEEGRRTVSETIRAFDVMLGEKDDAS
jgi:hypothetical protein